MQIKIYKSFADKTQNKMHIICLQMFLRQACFYGLIDDIYLWMGVVLWVFVFAFIQGLSYTSQEVFKGNLDTLTVVNDYPWDHKLQKNNNSSN